MVVNATWPEWNTSTTYATPVVGGSDGSNNITFTNFGSVNQFDIVAATNPITAGSNSFNKKHAVKFEILNSETVDTFYFGATAGLSGTGDITGNNDTYNFKDVGNKTDVTVPSAATLAGTTGVPNVSAGFPAPPATNVAGGPCTATGQGTNYFVHQVTVHALSTTGTSITVGLRYVVVA